MSGLARRSFRPVLVSLLAVAALIACGASQAAAEGEIYEFRNYPSTSEAGGHPDIVTNLEVANRFHTTSPVVTCCHDPRDIDIHTPAGVVATPHVLSECPPDQIPVYECSADAQAGIVIINHPLLGWMVLPMFKTVPQAGQAALFVFSLPGVRAIPQYLAVNSRTGDDYGLDFKFQGLTHAFPVTSTYTVFWGVPGAHKNDILRFAPGTKSMHCGSNPLVSLLESKVPVDCPVEVIGSGIESKKPVASSLPITPFTMNPTTCAGPMSSSVAVTYYDHTFATAEAPWPATTGCDKLSFRPSLAAGPTTTATDSASGLAVDLLVPQFEDEFTPSPSEIRGNSVTLPAGFSINPSAADGKTTCSNEQANLTSEGPAECPETAKIGTTELSSTALPGPIFGYIYLGAPLPGDRWRIVLTASGYATNAKILGSAKLDPSTGQVTTTFENLPQTPLEEFNLHFFGSERGLFATPTQCGTYPVKTLFQPWALELSEQTSTQFFNVESGPEGAPCPNGPRPFSPTFESGVEDNTAATHSPFVVQLRRADGDQNLAGADVKAPRGLLATLRGIPYCPEAAIAKLRSPGYSGQAEQSTPACPAASRVGSAMAGAGAGTHPVYVPGQAYLAGPYKGAPLSLVVSVPALSGPYDLGVVAVRVALHVDPETAQVRADSDPIPQIQEGVPLRTRFVRIDLDRLGFALNPTNCGSSAVDATVAGSEGATASRSAHFQAANCTDLSFAPKISLKVTGSSKRRGHPALSATVATKAGEANIARTVVALPPSLILDNSHIGTLCTRVQFAADACPEASRLGTARASTPLLDKPLEGSVYLRSSSDKLPNVVVALKGQIDIDLVGRIGSSKGGGLRTNFSGLPDAPITSFDLSLVGGKKGLLQNTESLCNSSQAAKVQMAGQNGLERNRKVKLDTGCGAPRKPKRDHRHGRTAGKDRGATR